MSRNIIKIHITNHVRHVKSWWREKGLIFDDDDDNDNDDGNYFY